jgi:glyoxylase-like metal-dependent hydrolase (beta-lactamase superfamily II)
LTEKVRIGDVEIWALLDMIPPPYAPDFFFPTIPSQAWQPYRSEILDEGGQLQLYYGCFVVRSQGKLILVDTGMGPGPHPERGNRRGDLLNQMRMEGLSPGEVDFVVHTHLHADHIGWNIAANGKATFPKARYLVPKADWDYFSQPQVLKTVPAMERSVIPLKGLGVMDLVERDYPITPEVSTLATPGHTPGHMNVLISSNGEKGVVVGDLIQSMVQVMEPEWCPRADVDPEKARGTRLAMVKRIEEEGMVMAAGHFKTGAHFGRIVRVKGRRYWQIASPQA